MMRTWPVCLVFLCRSQTPTAFTHPANLIHWHWHLEIALVLVKQPGNIWVNKSCGSTANVILTANAMHTYVHSFHTYAFSDIECGRPEVPRHGFLLEGVEYTYPNTVTFACEDGYVLTGHSIIRCESNGLWSEASPKCLPIGKPWYWF